MFCALAYTSSIPRGAIHFSTQERFLHSLADTVIDLEFVHANLKCYLKTSIILSTGEQSSKYPFALLLGLYPSWSFMFQRRGAATKLLIKQSKGGKRVTVQGTVIFGASHLPVCA